MAASLMKSGTCSPLVVPLRKQGRLSVCDSRFRNSLSHLSVPPQRVAERVEVTTQDCCQLCEQGELQEAVAVLGQLVKAGSHVSRSLIYTLLRRCLAQKDLTLGRRIHALVVECGYRTNTFLANHILRMYASHGRLQEAKQVFAQVSVPDTYMWFTIISAHAKHGEFAQAIDLYKQMRQSIVKPDNFVFVAALKACTASGDLETGRQLHGDVLTSGIVPDIFVLTSLVDMYAKCGNLGAARGVFDKMSTRNVVTWTTMIAGYANHGLGQEAITLYAQMEQEGVVLANTATFACLLKACASVGALQQGKKLHSQILQRGLDVDLVLGNALVDMYAKCGSLGDAHRVFDNLDTRDVVTWDAMIRGYTDHGFGEEALALYARMEQEGMIVADKAAFSCLVIACANIGALQQGKQLHAQIRDRGFDTDEAVGSCLVDMYAQCGRLEDACRVFGILPEKNVITWTAMLNAFGRNNAGHQAIQCFEEMLQNGVSPNEVTFTCLLVACSKEGLVKEGRQYFHAMVDIFRITPTTQHYVCMIDLLGRSGHIDEAEQMLLSMHLHADATGWMALLTSCRTHGYISTGRRCFENLVRLDPQHASPYMLMEKIYADAGMWVDVDSVESLRKSAGANKKPAKAGIEVNKQVRTFVVGEDKDDMLLKVGSMSGCLKEGGYIPHTELVLMPGSNKQKEDDLCGHAEKLALAYGLLNTPEGMPLLVTKNLRMCGDCHSATKTMSRIEKREITVRDAQRVHCFVGGSCSCGDRP